MSYLDQCRMNDPRSGIDRHVGLPYEWGNPKAAARTEALRAAEPVDDPVMNERQEYHYYALMGEGKTDKAIDYYLSCYRRWVERRQKNDE